MAIRGGNRGDVLDMSVFTHWPTITPAACLWHRVGRAFTGAVGSSAMLAIGYLVAACYVPRAMDRVQRPRVFTRNQEPGAGMDLEQ
jgi:hypothetical protein